VLLVLVLLVLLLLLLLLSPQQRVQSSQQAHHRPQLVQHSSFQQWQWAHAATHRHRCDHFVPPNASHSYDPSARSHRPDERLPRTPAPDIYV
jgi:hypothetical protein